MCFEAIRTLEQRAAEKAAEKERIDGLLETIKKLKANVGFSIEQSMNALEVSESDRLVLKKML